VAKAADIERSLKREINSRGYILLIKLFWTKFSDAQCGFGDHEQAARELLPQVHDGEWFWDTELLVIAEGGYRLKEVPVRWVGSDSRVKFPHDIIAMARQLLRLRMRRMPRRAGVAWTNGRRSQRRQRGFDHVGGAAVPGSLRTRRPATTPRLTSAEAAGPTNFACMRRLRAGRRRGAGGEGQNASSSGR
jgi:hypothetical protein